MAAARHVAFFLQPLRLYADHLQQQPQQQQQRAADTFLICPPRLSVLPSAGSGSPDLSYSSGNSDEDEDNVLFMNTAAQWQSSSSWDQPRLSCGADDLTQQPWGW